MARQIIENDPSSKIEMEEITAANSKAAKPKPIRLPIFYGFVIGAIGAVAIEQIVFPNLRDNLGFLALFTFTTFFGITSLGLTFSGLRTRLSKPLKILVSVLVWGFALLDVIFLVLPSVLPGPTAQDAPVNFAVSSQPTALANVTSTFAGVFNNQGQTPVAGKVTIGKTTSGQLILRFEDFNSADGPDLHVYLTKEVSPSNDTQIKNGLEVGKLKATQGTLNYDLDSSLDLGQYKAVAIYCKSVSVVFGYANLGQLQPAPATGIVQSPKGAQSAVLSGTFNNQGAEPVAGKVSLGQTADGKVVLRLEELKSASGPDLHVYLSKDGNPSSDAQVKNGLEVGKLKATQGSLNYELPNSTDLNQYKSVVIYCNSVSVIFGYANLTTGS